MAAPGAPHEADRPEDEGPAAPVAVSALPGTVSARRLEAASVALLERAAAASAVAAAELAWFAALAAWAAKRAGLVEGFLAVCCG